MSAETGEISWRHEIPSPIECSPAFDANRDRLLVGADDGVVYAVDSSSGEEAWRFSTAGAVKGLAKIAEQDGLVSIEDVVEAIVGDIEDEHDEADAREIAQAGDGVYIAEGRASLETVSRVLGVDLSALADAEYVDTIGGLIIAGRAFQNRIDRGTEIGNGWDPQWHQPTDVYATYNDKDFRLGLNAAQTTLAATAELAGPVAVPSPKAAAFGEALRHLDVTNVYTPYWR